ncbi:RDD family protein [Frankia sp. KB5]|uniref:RDD family protein n=1 Tax=Frankia sp. KB5 TaxID=683318 RepID=UPI000A0FF0F7|nr:RDD family protein [Frankia sp. KB5]ORT55853.1 hypothetical protein KBI5_01950 [Frankia sp. KB5]
MNQVVTGKGSAGLAGTGVLTGEAIVTGEAITIELRVARLGSRLIAGLLDLLIQLYILYAVGAAALLIVRPDNDALIAAVFLLVYVGVVLGYPVTCETLTRGRTLGKMAMGLRVVRDDGGPIHFRHAFARGLVGAVVERPGLLLGLPAVISMLVSKHAKRLGDVFAGTVVLQASVPRPGGAPPSVPPQLVGWAATLDLTGLDDALALRARQFLGRAHELSPQALERLGSGLVRQVRAVVTPPPPPGTPGWAYLSAVLAERTRRAYHRLTANRPRSIPSPVFSPYPTAQYPTAQYPTAQYPTAQYPTAQYPTAQYPTAQDQSPPPPYPTAPQPPPGR